MLASDLWKKLQESNTVADHDTDCSTLLIDNPHDAINVAIVIKNAERFSDAQTVLLQIIDRFPTYSPAFHELALVLRYQNRHRASLKFARRAYALEQSYKYTLVLQLCACGLADDARSVINCPDWTTSVSNREDRIYGEFAGFITQFPLAAAEAAIERIIEAGTYLDAATVESRILSAVETKRPFALTRLGDGEGAWTFLSREDECRYGSLYRMNRTSFLHDWFGSDDLIDDEQFFQFAIRFSQRLEQSDIVGITDIPRLRH